MNKTITSGLDTASNEVSAQFFDSDYNVVSSYVSTNSAKSLQSVAASEFTDIGKFLARPIAYAGGTFADSRGISDILEDINSVDIFSIVQINDKIKGFRLFRGTLCVKLVINGMPFQAGRLLLTYDPFFSEYESIITARHYKTFTNYTQLPHVEVDLRDGSGVLKIPYMGPNGWYDRASGYCNYGNFKVIVLSPLLTGVGGMNNADYTVWVWFEDVELAVPYVAQATGFGRSKVRATRKVKLEADAMSDQPISEALACASKVSFALGRIPLLSSFAKPLGAMFNISSDLASYFGWSKPTFAGPLVVTSARSTRSIPNSTGPVNADVLGLDCGNSTEIAVGLAGTDVDEMSYNYLKAIPAMIEYFSLSTASAQGDMVYHLIVGPTMFRQTTTTSTPAFYVNNYPPFAYVATKFAYARGSIIVNLKFIKTIFHSGRIMLVWVASNDYSLATPSVGDVQSCMRSIIDIRDATDFEFTLPYGLAEDWQVADGTLGHFYIYIINPIRAPDSVNSTLAVNVWVSAGPDFELAGPSANVNQPYVAQSGDSESAIDHNMQANIGDEPTLSITNTPASRVMGEAFTSIKQLVTRFTKCYWGISGVEGSTNISIWPWFTGVIRLDSVIAAQSGLLGDDYSFYGVGYALQKGGMRFLFRPSSNVNVNIQYNPSGSPDRVAKVNGDVTTKYSIGTAQWAQGTTATTPNDMVYTSTEIPIVHCPQYQKNAVRLTGITYDTANSPTDMYFTNRSATGGVPAGMINLYFGGSHTLTDVRRSGADDTQFMLFTGFPGLVTGTTV